MNFDYPTNHSTNGTLRAYMGYSTNFQAGYNAGFLSHCATSTGFLACGTTDFIRTGKRLAVGWDDRHNRTLVAWANQNRLTNADSRRVRIAVGVVDNTTLGPPFDAPVRSSVGPGVACKSGEAGGYDCILAYVDDGDTVSDVAIRRFSNYATTTGYAATWDPTPRSLSISSFNALTAWFHNAYFYVGLVTASGQIRVYRSLDGATWSLFTYFSGQSSVVGPSSVSYFTANNQIGWFSE
ncbi:MAG: hypothetical protein R3E66_02140 [bacterium]